MKTGEFGHYWEDFTVGETVVHQLRKTITENDNVLFCNLTMNHHPLHLDSEYARGSQFGQRVVAGTYTLSLAVGISVEDISGKAIANLGFSKVQHLAPVFIGDTISAETEILDKRLSKHKPDRGIIEVETRAFNQNGVKVLVFTRQVLIPRRINKSSENG
ncbi:MAG: MaoC family dehydratase [Candidatus Cloacimonetes bacterium]|nr:MaoC family dehydratase [Candidatus Cloacimonadota bacterium]